MMTKRIATFCFALFQGVNLTKGLLSETTPDGQDRDLETRIFGGSVADATRFPYYTFVRISSAYEGSVSCGGSLIAPDVVLTAAHCLSPFYSFDIPVVDVFVNSTSRKYSDSDYYRDGIKMIMHEDYSLSPRDHDIGLVFLDAPVLGVPLVKLNRDASVPISNNPPPVTAIGLGATGEVTNDLFPAYEYAKVLMNAQINPLSTTACIKTYGSGVIGDGNLCAGGNGVQGVCSGDSGGPLLVKGSSAPNDVQIGITSWGAGCAADGYPDVYTRVSYFVQWVDTQVCKFSKSKPATCPTLRPTRKPTAKPATARA